MRRHSSLDRLLACCSVKDSSIQSLKLKAKAAMMSDVMPFAYRCSILTPILAIVDAVHINV